MTHTETVDAIMEVMQNFVNAEREKIWRLVTKQNKKWCENARRFVQHYVDMEKKSPQDALNQVYAKGVFAGGSVGSVMGHAKELLLNKSINSEEFDSQSKIQIAFPFGHRHFCTYGTVDGKFVPCNCGLHNALAELKENDDE